MRAKSSDPHHSDTYTFNISTLLEFARKLVAAEREACAAHTWLFEEWWEKNWEGMGEIADDAGKFIAKAAWDAATGYERDACANVCESLFDMNGGSCAEAVRLRSNVEHNRRTAASSPGVRVDGWVGRQGGNG